MKREPIQYTIENKKGVYEYSDSFEINDTVKIRINILHPVAERNWLTSIVKNISIKGDKVPFDDSGSAWSGQCSTVNDLRNKVFVNNTNDLKFELIENSKIAIMLLFKEHETPICDYEPPTIMPEIKIQQKEFEKVKKIQFEVERIDGVVKFTPESIIINKDIGLIRITSTDEKTNCDVVFDFNGNEYDTSKILSAYGFPQYLRDIPIYRGKNGLLMENINEIHFKKVPEKIKFKVELFERQPINIKRNLK